MFEKLLQVVPWSDILLYISLGLICCALLQKNSNFLDIRKVFADHVAIFDNSPLQKFVIFIVPFLLSISAISTQLLTKDIVNNLNIVLSILISMFFAILSILSSFTYKSTDPKTVTDVSLRKKAEKYNKLLKQTFNAVIFESVLSIVVLILSFAQLFSNDFSETWKLKVISLIVYYLALVIVFNILVVIKRMKSLFETKADN